MLLLITNALVETLVKHMFGNFLKEQDKIELDGAPSWYMNSVDDEMCVFTHKSGGIDYIDITKNNAKLKMIKKINGTIDIVIYENSRNITNKKEQAVVDFWKNDSKLPTFVDKNLRYSRVKFEKEIDTTFVRACIPNNIIIDYQKERLVKIKKEVTKFKSNNALDELDNELNGLHKAHKNHDDPFSELP
ncbi:MAG: hypothetical protein U9O56_01495 [Campylobacterota bacterium]|nr:hypothetical protein [Campylobacterota bacterium]